MTPDEKQAFKKAIPKAKEIVKSAIRHIEADELKSLVIEADELKSLVRDSLKAIELLLEIANKSLDDS